MTEGAIQLENKNRGTRKNKWNGWNIGVGKWRQS
jgi:hypothetical protein